MVKTELTANWERLDRAVKKAMQVNAARRGMLAPWGRPVRLAPTVKKARKDRQGAMGAMARRVAMGRAVKMVPLVKMVHPVRMAKLGGMGWGLTTYRLNSEGIEVSS